MAREGLHLGLGDGTFQSSAIPLVCLFTAPTNLTAIAAVRAGDRGELDLVVAGYDPSALTNKLQVLVGRGDGTFHARSPVHLRGFAPSAIASGNFTDGGHTDLALVGHDTVSGEGRLLILPGHGDGTFDSAVANDLGPGFFATSLVADDFNRDEWTDIAVAGYVQLDPTPEIPVPATVPPLPPTDDGLPPAPAPIILPPDPPLPGTSLLPTPSQQWGSPSQTAQGYGLVTILAGKGDGRFGPAKQSFYTSWRVNNLFSNGLIPLSLIAGEFTGGGGRDLAFVEHGTGFTRGAVIVLPGQGDGTFETPRLLVTQNAPYTLAAGDLVGDGSTALVIGGERTDLAGPTAASERGFFQVLTNAGGGAYTPFSDATYTPQVPNVIKAGAFTRSGRVDLVVAGRLNSTSFDNNVEVYAGLGSGKLLLPADMSSSRLPTLVVRSSTILAGDFNEDGKLDVLRAFSESGHQNVIEFLPGTGSGTFGDPLVIDRVQSGLLQLTGGNILIGDFTGDGHLDVAICVLNLNTSDDQPNDRIDVILGNGEGNFQTPVTIGRGNFTGGLVTGNFQGDGHHDIAVMDMDTDGSFFTPSYSIEVFRAARDGVFSTPIVVPLGNGPNNSLAQYAATGPWLVAGDFHRTGRDDIAFLSEEASLNVNDKLVLKSRIGIVKSQPDGTFAAPYFVDPGNQSVDGMIVGDFNGDGRMDLAVTGHADSEYPFYPALKANLPEYSTLRIFTGGGDGTFDTTAAGYAVAVNDPMLTEGDFNADSRADIVVVGNDGAFYGTNYVYVLLGQGTGRFQEPSGVYSIPRSDSWTFADFAGLGRADFAFNAGHESIRVAYALGDGRFADPADYAAAVHNTPIAADVTGTGTVDVFVTDQAGDILWPRGGRANPALSCLRW